MRTTIAEGARVRQSVFARAQQIRALRRVKVVTHGPEAGMTFEEYATARLPALLRYAAVLTGNTDLAQDIVQEVLARVHARWHRIAALAVPDQYVRRMVTNEFLSWRRRWGRQLPVATVAEDRRPAAMAEPPDAADVHAERDALLAEVSRLPRKQQVVLVLRYYEGLSDPEIAAVLGCRPGTVRGYASRALAALRIGLDPALLSTPTTYNSSREP